MRGNVVAKPNYHQARKQRELARRARQQEKQQRRDARAKVAGASQPAEMPEDAASTPEIQDQVAGASQPAEKPEDAASTAPSSVVWRTSV